jgi:uncharacterized membrane protein
MDARAGAAHQPVNMHPIDRALSGIAGGALLLAAVRRGEWPGLLLGLAGVGMLYRGVSGNCPGYTALGISTTSAGEPDRPGARDDAPIVERWITIGKERDEVYALLEQPDVLTRMMEHVADVRVDGDAMHWRMHGLFGRSLEWEARIVERRPGERLSWLSAPGAALRSEGSLSLSEAPGGRGTVVALQLAYSPPGGSLGGAAMKLLRVVPESVALRALQRLKSLAETGEIPTTAFDPSGREQDDARIEHSHDAPTPRAREPLPAPLLAGSPA